MARIDVVMVQTNQTLFLRMTLQAPESFPDRLHKGDGPEKWMTRYAVWELRSYVVICAEKSGARGLGIGWGWRSWALLERGWYTASTFFRFRSKLVTVPTLLVRNRVFALVFWRSGGQVWSLQHAYTNKTQAHCAKPLSPMFSSATLSLFALTAPPPSPSKTSTPKLNRAGTLFLIKPSPSSGASIHSIVPSPGGFTQPFTHHYHRCYGYCCYRSSYPQTKLES